MLSASQESGDLSIESMLISAARVVSTGGIPGSTESEGVIVVDCDGWLEVILKTGEDGAVREVTLRCSSWQPVG